MKRFQDGLDVKSNIEKTPKIGRLPVPVGKEPVARSSQPSPNATPRSETPGRRYLHNANAHSQPAGEQPMSKALIGKPHAAIQPAKSSPVNSRELHSLPPGTPPVTPGQFIPPSAANLIAGVSGSRAISSAGFTAGPRLDDQPRFVIRQRPAPFVASFHKASATQLHQRLGNLMSSNRAAGGAAPHTSSWLNERRIQPWWGSVNEMYWSWGAAGLSGLNPWLGNNWSFEAPPFIYYTGGQPLMPFDDAIGIPEQAIMIGDQSAMDEEGWIPLGVFGLLPPGASDYVATIQLAVNQKGVVRGVALETGTGQVYEATGGFDRSKQRIAWTIPGDDALKFETSLANLLQNESLVNVYDPVARTVNAWQVVRDLRADQ
jgi:hypothetical protein